MPQGDGTGPGGQGPNTGRGRGGCWNDRLPKNIWFNESREVDD